MMECGTSILEHLVELLCGVECVEEEKMNGVCENEVTRGMR